MNYETERRFLKKLEWKHCKGSYEREGGEAHDLDRENEQINFPHITLG
jgi:hypothetical protein